MTISKDWTERERLLLAALIVTECRNAAMRGQYPKGKYGNSETAAVILVAPASFLEAQRHSIERIAKDVTEDTIQICWNQIARDIKALFPSTDFGVGAAC